jgi:hypothetical protein
LDIRKMGVKTRLPDLQHFLPSSLQIIPLTESWVATKAVNIRACC